MSNDERTRNRFQQQPELLSPQKKNFSSLSRLCQQGAIGNRRPRSRAVGKRCTHAGTDHEDTHRHSYIYVSLFVHTRARSYLLHEGNLFRLWNGEGGGCIGLLEERERERGVLDHKIFSYHLRLLPSAIDGNGW